eukprot:scaffold114210_cov55-Attheya_sp.AAC.3
MRTLETKSRRSSRDMPWGKTADVSMRTPVRPTMGRPSKMARSAASAAASAARRRRCLRRY